MTTLRISSWLPPALLVVVAGLAACAAWLQSAADQRATSAEFHRATEQIELRIAERMETLRSVVRAAAAQVGTTPGEGPAAFTRWTRHMQMGDAYPELHGIGFAARVAPGGVQALDVHARALGLKEFSVWPLPRPDAESSAVLYVEPPVRGHAVVGFDMSSEPVRAAAMRKAADSGFAALSAPVQLAGSPTEAGAPAIVIFAPVYASEVVPDTVTARRAALTGWVFAPIRTADLFQQSLGGTVEDNLSVEITDQDGDRLVTVHPLSETPVLSTPSRIDTLQREWRLQYAAGPAFHRLESHVPVTFFMGLGVALVTAVGARLVLRARERSLALAEDVARSRFALIESESQLRDSEARTRAIVETIPQIVFVADGVQGIEEINRRWAESTGRPAVSALGHGWLEAVHPDDQARALLLLHSDPRRGPSNPMELRLAMPDGGWRWHHAAALRAPGDGHAVPRWFGAFTDVDKLRRAEAAVREAQRLESVGVLAGGVAHDFNNLLTAITGYGSLAVRQLAAEHPARPMVGRMVEAARAAAHLTRQLLAYAGKGRFFVEKVDFVSVVRETSDLLRGAVTRNVGLEVNLPDTPVWVEADAGQLRQVVLNLVLNAAQAIGDAPGIVQVTVNGDGNHVRLRVCDDGTGMDAKTRARIFEPFFSTRGEGRGLGLAAVFGIVKGHKGRIEVRSQIGVGSEFEVTLTQRAAPSMESMPPVPTRPPGELSVLVVDDEHAVRDVAVRALRARGWKADAVESGEEALRALRSRPKHWRVVMLDLVMPGIGGAETLAAIRREHGGMRVLVTSGFGEEETLRRLADHAAEGFCPKPFTDTELCDAIQRAASISGERAPTAPQ